MAEEHGWEDLSSIFERLLDSESPEAELSRIEDPQLRAAAEKLWLHHVDAGSEGFLKKTPPVTLGIAFEPGQRLCDRFVIVRHLGSGGMGQVYLANDERLGGVVALKTIAPILAPLPHMKRRFLAEVQNARRVTHRNICRIHDYFEDGPYAFFAMEFLEGETLDAILRSRKVDPPLAHRWLLQLAEGLQAAHDEGILHGDFKPGNVIVTAAGTAESRAVITDFGLARALEEPPKAAAGTVRDSMQAGTAEYMAPEVLLGGPPSVAADLYAFGRVAEKLLPSESWWRPYLEPRPSGRPASLWKPAIEVLKPGERWLSRRNLAAAGLLGAVGLATGLWGRKQLAAVIPKGSRILVNGIVSAGPLAAKARSLRNAFLTGVQQSPRLQLIPDRELFEELRRASPKEDRLLPLDAQKLQPLLRLFGANYWLESQLAEVSGLLMWKVALHRAADGLAVLERRFGDNASALQIAEAGVVWLRDATGESEESLRINGGRITAFTTGSADALDRYAEGMERYYAGEMLVALPLFEDAVRIDPSFAQAHAMLGMSYNVARQTAKAVASLERAMALAVNLPEQERSVIAANYYKMVEDPVRMVSESRKNVSWRSYDPYYSRQLANLLCWTGAADQSIAPIRQAIDSAPRQQMLMRELLVNLCEAGRYEEALEEWNKARAAGITHPWVLRGAGLVYMCLEDYDQAAQAFERLPALDGRVLHGPRFLKGSVDAALAGWLRDRAAARAGGSMVEEHEYTEHLAAGYWLTDRESLARSELALCPVLPECPPNGRRMQAELFWTVRLGLYSGERARQIEDALGRIGARWPNGFNTGMLRYAQALGARAAGDWSRAEALITESAGMAFSVWTLAEAAEIVAGAGKLDLADEYWSRFEQRKGTVLKLWFPGLVLYGWRKRMHLAAIRKDRTGVRRCAAKIVKHWGSAQPQTSIVAEARKHLAEN